MKTIFIKNINLGEFIDDIFFLSERKISQKKDGNNYATLTLSDKTGNIKGVIWENSETILNGINAGSVVNVKGSVSEYSGSLQIIVKSLEKIPIESANPYDYLPVTNKNIDGMFERILKLIGTIQNEYLSKLLNSFFSNHDFASKFKTAPAAKKMHHAYLGGLLEHSLSTAMLVDKIGVHYNGIDRDLLLTGAILHDIGKVREFEYKFNIDYSDEGRLLSHIVIGLEIVSDKIKEIQNFPSELATKLKHLIISHHGHKEFGSPEPPKTLEALLLYYLDEIDSKINGVREFIASEDSNEKWTSYHRLMDRYFYKK
ncbi:MAG: HD domain-containing protein [Desulfobacterales bacterium]|nr:HD domain-containing protein [Desulfobacterales bacterium]